MVRRDRISVELYTSGCAARIGAWPTRRHFSDIVHLVNGWHAHDSSLGEMNSRFERTTESRNESPSQACLCQFEQTRKISSELSSSHNKSFLKPHERRKYYTTEHLQSPLPHEHPPSFPCSSRYEHTSLSKIIREHLLNHSSTHPDTALHPLPPRTSINCSRKPSNSRTRKANTGKTS